MSFYKIILKLCFQLSFNDISNSFLNRKKRFSTPLLAALQNKNEDIVKLLLAHPEIDINLFIFIYDYF